VSEVYDPRFRPHRSDIERAAYGTRGEGPLSRPGFALRGVPWQVRRCASQCDRTGCGCLGNNLAPRALGSAQEPWSRMVIKVSAAAICLAAIVLSAPSSAQYGGYGEGRRGGGDRYDEGRRGDGYGGGRARGSFAATCRDIDQRGPFLTAMCRTRRGGYEPARINMERCGGRPIANQDGRLTC
jgi:hypothetical protein